MLRADPAKTRDRCREAVASAEQVFQIGMRDKVFDVDVRWVRPLIEGDRSLEPVGESTRRRSSVRARGRVCKKE